MASAKEHFPGYLAAISPGQSHEAGNSDRSSDDLDMTPVLSDARVDHLFRPDGGSWMRHCQRYFDEDGRRNQDKEIKARTGFSSFLSE